MPAQRALTIEEMCNKLKPVFGKKIDEIYLRYAMSNTREEKEEIASMINALYHQNLSKLLDKKPLLEPPTQEQMAGEYPIAKIKYADKSLYDFNLREQDWPRHLCISGMSGSGKTTLAFHIVDNFIKKEKPFLMFDWKKSFRPLLQSSPNLMCLTIGDENVTNNFKVNINIPPLGIKPEEWINVLCDLITESFFVSYGVHKVLLETLDMAFKKNGVYEGSGNYPNWEDIKQYLEQKAESTHGREAQWVESALRVATVLTFGNFGKVVNAREEHSSIEELMDRQAIFELSALSNIEKKFFCEFILMYLYKMQKVKTSVNHTLFDYAIIVDEAHNIFLKDKTHFVNESVTDMIYREIREYGTSLICLDQHISKLSDTVKGNSACHIAFQQQLPEDINDISGIMQMRERRELFSQLPVGTAIVKLSERYTSPFLIEVADVPMRKSIITDQELVERVENIVLGRKILPKNEEINNQNPISESVPEAQIPTQSFDLASLKFDSVEIKQELTPKQSVLHKYIQSKLAQGVPLRAIEQKLENHLFEGGYTREDVMRAINKALETKFTENTQNTPKIGVSKQINNPITTNNDKNYIDLSEDEKALLDFLKRNPDHELATVEVYKKSGLSTRKGNNAKKALLAKNLILVQETKNNKGWKKFIKPVL